MAIKENRVKETDRLGKESFRKIAGPIKAEGILVNGIPNNLAGLTSRNRTYILDTIRSKRSQWAVHACRSQSARFIRFFTYA